MSHLLVDDILVTPTRRRDAARRGLSPTPRRPAFSIVDLLVSIAVIAVLLALLSPTLSQVREVARRVKCASNVRQMGFGIAMYSEDYADWLPPSIYLANGVAGTSFPQRMNTLRADPAEVPQHADSAWDGLGDLYWLDYLPAAPLYYCPSHTGDNPFARYVEAWSRDSGVIRGNYQYRGEGPTGIRLLSVIRPGSAALVTDSMASQSDFNHRVGSNVLRADLGVYWFDDPGRKLFDLLPPTAQSGSAEAIRDAWESIDTALGPNGPG
jgi:type II secretory pathway pseudopilin PulG